MMLVCLTIFDFILTSFGLRLTLNFVGTQEAAKMLLIQPITGMTMSVLFGSLEIYNKFPMKYILILTNWHGLNLRSKKGQSLSLRLSKLEVLTLSLAQTKPEKHHGCIVLNSIFLRI